MRKRRSVTGGWRCHLGECRAGTGLPAEVVIDQRAQELVVPGLLVAGQGGTEPPALERQQLGRTRAGGTTVPMSPVATS